MLFPSQERRTPQSAGSSPSRQHVASSTSHASLSDTASRSKRKGCGKRLWETFSKQETPGHRTIFSLRFAIVIFLAMCAAFLVGGGILLTYSLAQVQIRVIYSDIAPLDNLSNEQRSLIMQGLEDEAGVNVTRPCPGCPLASQIVMRVEQDMEAPIHIYYILHNFYQNHKRYVRSANYNQMHGEDSGSSSLKPCIPRLYVTGEGDGNFTNNGLVKPCGLVSWSTFNDTFTNFRIMQDNDTLPARLEEVEIDDSKLVWDSDRNNFFSNYTTENLNTITALRGGREITLPVNEDEHFMHWLRPAAHPNVRKFFGIIHKDLKKGDRLVFEVTHQFNTYGFDGVKELLFTTAGPFGNRNLTFGIVWLIMGVLNGTITFVYIGLGWHQLWNPDRRVEDLRKRWGKGSKFSGMQGTNGMSPAEMHRS